MTRMRVKPTRSEEMMQPRSLIYEDEDEDPFDCVPNDMFNSNTTTKKSNVPQVEYVVGEYNSSPSTTNKKQIPTHSKSNHQNTTYNATNTTNTSTSKRIPLSPSHPNIPPKSPTQYHVKSTSFKQRRLQIAEQRKWRETHREKVYQSQTMMMMNQDKKNPDHQSFIMSESGTTILRQYSPIINRIPQPAPPQPPTQEVLSSPDMSKTRKGRNIRHARKSLRQSYSSTTSRTQCQDEILESEGVEVSVSRNLEKNADQFVSLPPLSSSNKTAVPTNSTILRHTSNTLFSQHETTTTTTTISSNVNATPSTAISSEAFSSSSDDETVSSLESGFFSARSNVVPKNRYNNGNTSIHNSKKYTTTPAMHVHPIHSNSQNSPSSPPLSKTSKVANTPSPPAAFHHNTSHYQESIHPPLFVSSKKKNRRRSSELSETPTKPSLTQEDMYDSNTTFVGNDSNDLNRTNIISNRKSSMTNYHDEDAHDRDDTLKRFQNLIKTYSPLKGIDTPIHALDETNRTSIHAKSYIKTSDIHSSSDHPLDESPSQPPSLARNKLSSSTTTTTITTTPTPSPQKEKLPPTSPHSIKSSSTLTLNTSFIGSMYKTTADYDTPFDEEVEDDARTTATAMTQQTYRTVQTCLTVTPKSKEERDVALKRKQRKLYLLHHALKCKFRPAPFRSNSSLSSSFTVTDEDAVVDEDDEGNKKSNEDVQYCKEVNHCYALTVLVKHVQTCSFSSTDPSLECEVPGCASYKRLWNHYRRCVLRTFCSGDGREKEKTCRLCKPIYTNNDEESDEYTMNNEIDTDTLHHLMMMDVE